MEISYANAKLKASCLTDPMVMTKLVQLKTKNGLGETVGPSNLNMTYEGKKYPAWHCHVTNKTGIAFCIVGEFIQILALGKKNANIGKGDSGYKWSKEG